MSWSAPVIHSTGDVVTASDWNIDSNDLTFLDGLLTGLDQFQVHLGTAVSINNNTFTTVAYDTVDSDTASGWSATTHTYTVQTAGMWNIGILMRWASNSTGNRGTQLAINGAGTPNIFPANLDPSSIGRQIVSVSLLLGVGDTVTVQGFQTSGSALNTGAGKNIVQLAGVRVI